MECIMYNRSISINPFLCPPEYVLYVSNLLGRDGQVPLERAYDQNNVLIKN